MMEVTTKPKRVVILAGPVAEVEEQLNWVLDDYAATVWALYECAGVPFASVVLVSLAELRKQAFMQAGAMARR